MQKARWLSAKTSLGLNDIAGQIRRRVAGRSVDMHDGAGIEHEEVDEAIDRCHVGQLPYRRPVAAAARNTDGLKAVESRHRPFVIAPELAPRPAGSNGDLPHRPGDDLDILAHILLPTLTVPITQNGGPRAIAHHSIESCHVAVAGVSPATKLLAGNLRWRKFTV